MNILHLSDIHFSIPIGDERFDLHALTRAACIQDALAFGAEYGSLDYVVLTGDAAASGRVPEYEYLGKWLDELCGTLRIGTNNVMMVPGNHDVDRSAVRSSYLIRKMHETVRAAGTLTKMDSEWLEIMRDAAAVRELFSPLHDYNEFSSRYMCQTTPAKTAWTRQVEFMRGLSIDFVGFNSVLLSDENDDEAKGKLYVGPVQTHGLPTPGLIGICLCHHPKDWLFDAGEIRRIFRNRFAVQLFGHKHDAERDSGEESFVLGAGALQPPAGSGITPEFSYLQLEACAGDRLRILLHRRRWEHEDQHFLVVPSKDRNLVIESFVDIARFSPKPSAEISAAPIVTSTGTSESDEDETMMLTNPDREAARRLVYAFHMLKPLQQRAVLNSLGIVPENEEMSFDGASVARYFELARRAGKLADLWTSTYTALRRSDEANPFEGR